METKTDKEMVKTLILYNLQFFKLKRRDIKVEDLK